MVKRVWCLIFIFIFLQTSFAADRSFSEESFENSFSKEAFIESARTEHVLRLGLVDCIIYALKNNSEIKIKSIEPKLKEDDIRIAKSGFEPTLSANYTLSNNTKQSTSTIYPGISKSKDVDINVGLSGKLATGTEYVINLLNTRYKSNLATQNPNPYYTAEPKITITQPLFKNFGMLVNKADIIIAQNNKEASREGFRNTVIDTISNTKRAYYSYIFWLENYTIATLSLERAQHLLEINEKRYQKGLVSSVDLLEAESGVAARDKTLIFAESNLKKVEDSLKLITNLIDDPQAWNARLELIDSPEFKVEEISLVDALENAFKFRPDYEAAKIDLKNRDIRVKVTKNALFPTVDLIGSFGLNGLGEDYQEAIDEVSSDYKDWSVGVKLSVPWGGGDRAKYDQRKLEKTQSLIAFKRLEQHIILKVRDGAREVDMQFRQIKAAKSANEKEIQNYEAQKERYAVGQVSIHDMLDYQNNLSQAELDYIRALIDYNIAIINFEKAQGLTLVKNDIILEE